jgi:hypothetical protein
VANDPDPRRRSSQVCRGLARLIAFQSARDGVECAEADKSAHVPPSGGLREFAEAANLRIALASPMALHALTSA